MSYHDAGKDQLCPSGKWSLWYCSSVAGPENSDWGPGNMKYKRWYLVAIFFMTIFRGMPPPIAPALKVSQWQLSLYCTEPCQHVTIEFMLWSRCPDGNDGTDMPSYGKGKEMKPAEIMTKKNNLEDHAMIRSVMSVKLGSFCAGGGQETQQ